MAPHTYRVEYGGRSFTRRTDRTYTHVVLVRRNRRNPDVAPDWKAYAWAGRPDLAEKQRKDALRIYEDAVAVPIEGGTA